MRLPGTKIVFVALALALTSSLVACGTGDEESTAPEPVTEQEAEENAASESDGDEDPVSDSDTELPSGFPPDMPLPAGTESVREDAFTGGYSAFVPARDFADVIVELETELPASGWEIVERTSDIAIRGDMLFRVEGHGFETQVYVEPMPSSENDTHVLYSPYE